MARLRDPIKERFWRQVLAERDASGLSVRRYCFREKLAEASYYAWRRKLEARDAPRRLELPVSRHVDADRSVRAQRNATPKALPLFVAVDVEGSVGDSALEVVLATARTIRVRPGFDRDTLAQLIAVLEDRPC